MKAALTRFIQTIFSTKDDLQDAREGEVRVELAERDVRKTLHLLEVRKQNIRFGIKHKERKVGREI